ncbi:MAG TPA: mechanosensitive ion channel domain-containing protein [Candidatus Acidoferrales bacterium]|nr:mechanosensitive ion channel domain-containing protein [Candidatus Acidoferrales bacterium]
MRIHEKAIWIVVLALLGLSLGAVIFTHSWANYRERLQALRRGSQRSQALVDTRPLDTAQQLAPLAVTRTEHDYSDQTLRLADRSEDLAFAEAIYDAAQNPAPLTPKTSQMAARIKAAEEAVAADQGRVTQLTQALAKAPAASKDNVQALVVTAQAQLTLDQDDLEAAKQELVQAGGDKQAEIQQLLDQHEASDVRSASVAAAVAAASAAPSIERTDSKSIVAQFRAWSSLHSKELLLIQAQRDAQALAARLSASRAEAQTRMEQQRSSQTPLHAAAAAPPAVGTTVAATATPQNNAALSLLRSLTESQKNVASLGNHITTEQQLAAVYGDWISFVNVREKAFLHGAFVSIFWTLLIALFILIANLGVQRFFAEVTLERRQLRTMQTLLLFLVQALGVLLILLVVFGVPSNLATVLALAGAGLTVAMKDFIVGFFGWFVLMGKDGIRAGDWVEINGVGGEVLKVGLLHTVILETGNWTDPGHPTGRKVSFVNSFAIEGHYFNFSTSGQWLWDEIQVQVPETAEPYATAEAIQKIATDETTKNAQLAESEWHRAAPSNANRSFSAAPSLSVRPTGAGVNIVLRYITRANERYEVRARLFRAVVDLLHRKRIPESAASTPPPQPASGRA